MKIQNYIFLFILLGILLLPLVALAAHGDRLVPCGPGTGTPCQLCHFFVLFNNVYVFLLTHIVPPVAVLMIAIGGFMYVFAYFGAIAGEGGPALLTRAKKVFFYTIIGLIVIYASWLIVNLFFQVIGVADWTGLRERWWRINCPI